MIWAPIISALSAFFKAIWKPVAGYLFARQESKRRDAQKSDDLRKKALNVRKKHEEGLPYLTDDELDQRLRDLRKPRN